MSYISQQPYKCIKCKHEFRYSSDDFHSAPATSSGDPVCPLCWDTFLATVGLGYCTVKWTAEGSGYDKAVAALQNKSLDKESL